MPHILARIYTSMRLFYRRKMIFFTFFSKDIRLLLSYHFTKKWPSKIFKIEKFNRQTLNKIGLILTNEASFHAETLTSLAWKHSLELLFTCHSGIKACK